MAHGFAQSVEIHSRLFSQTRRLSLLGDKQMRFTHSLAKAATSLSSFHLFPEMTDCIEPIIANEMR